MAPRRKESNDCNFHGDTIIHPGKITLIKLVNNMEFVFFLYMNKSALVKVIGNFTIFIRFCFFHGLSPNRDCFPSGL